MPQLPPMPSHVFVPSLDAQYQELGMPPMAYQVCGQSLTAEGAVFVQVFTGSGYQWLAPSEYSVAPLPLDPEPFTMAGFGQRHPAWKGFESTFQPREGYEQDANHYPSFPGNSRYGVVPK